MSDSTQTITRYLLGELSEEERFALEERYFADQRVFEEVAAAETALVDDYVRGKLPAGTRLRFEQAYLADIGRRNRVRFAQALAARVDEAGAPPSGHGLRQPLTPDLEPASGWPSWLGVRWPSKPRLGFAAATVLLASTGIWVAIQPGQGREDSSPVDGRRDGQEHPTPRADPAEPGRAPEVDRPSPGLADQTRPPTRPSPQRLPPASFATLILAVSGDRGQDGGKTPVLVIPPGTANVQLRLRLREAEHARYQIVVRAIGGGEILRRADLRPDAEESGAVLTLMVPASRFSAGDYMLTLQGAAGGSKLEDLSQSLFRVER